MEQGCLLGDLPEQGAPFSAFLSILAPAPLAPSGHLGLVAALPSRPHFNGCVLQGSCRNRYLVSTLQDQLHHLRVHQPVHRLPVDVSDEVTLTKPRLTGWTSILHVPHHVVHSVDVRVTHVDTDGPQGEAILLASSVDDDGGS